MHPITGHTRVLAILADPIHHVQTPQRMNALLQAAGLDAVMVPLQVPPAGLAAAMAGLRVLANLQGMVVTVPHKTAALAFCDELGDHARLIGAVNVVRRLPDGRLRGDMLDGIGFVEGLRGAGIEPAGQSAYLAGAGGAASAIAFALAEAGVARLTLANRSLDKAEALAVRLRHHHPGLPVTTTATTITTTTAHGNPAGHSLVVNATSLGLHPGDALPLDVAALTPDQLVAEIIMAPADTALLQAARARGCRVHPGAPMLASQVRLMAAFLLDRPLDQFPASPAVPNR